jgi:benzoyl-CoA reductase/2-hydroxyglutaryl-CoA dehydratase subunit BcrC/BadD/HgdB
MKRVLFTCAFVPPEWIEAHGLEPYRVWPTGHHLSQARAGTCLYAASYADHASQIPGAIATIYTTVCDQMRRRSEHNTAADHAHVFLLNVPSTWQRPAAQKLYETELARLGRFLCRVGGQSPSSDLLVQIMQRRQNEREMIRHARSRLSARQHCQAWIDHFQGRPLRFPPTRPSVSLRSCPVALVGGPLVLAALELLDHIEQFGGEIMLDATESGEFCLPCQYRHPQLEECPLAELADAYFGGIPHPSRRPNDWFYQCLRREFEARGVRGILFFRYPWCDIWHAELQRVREETALPVLDLDLAEPSERKCQAVGRIQAFMEMLR